jgi:hypothetical protein
MTSNSTKKTTTLLFKNLKLLVNKSDLGSYLVIKRNLALMNLFSYISKFKTSKHFIAKFSNSIL